MTDLNSLIPAGSGWVLDGATAVNDAGQIAGYGTINGAAHAFLLTPATPTGLDRPSIGAAGVTAVTPTNPFPGDQPGSQGSAAEVPIDLAPTEPTISARSAQVADSDALPGATYPMYDLASDDMAGRPRRKK
jgi:probable HAF family extracellular repeat protein